MNATGYAPSSTRADKRFFITPPDRARFCIAVVSSQDRSCEQRVERFK
jgi:hypothetical protein